MAQIFKLQQKNSYAPMVIVKNVPEKTSLCGIRLFP